MAKMKMGAFYLKFFWNDLFLYKEREIEESSFFFSSSVKIQSDGNKSPI